MKLKNILLAGLAVASVAAVSSSFAGLTLCATTYPNQIDVKCTNASGVTKVGFPIPVNGCASFLGIKDLPWAGLKANVLSGESSGTCTFSDHTTGIAVAIAPITVDGTTANPQGTIGQPTSVPATVNVIPTPAWGTDSKEVRIDISEKTGL